MNTCVRKLVFAACQESPVVNILKTTVSCYTTEVRSQAIEKRRAQVMAKGLPKKRLIEGVAQIVLVSSGKGGVGKTTTAVNLASALKAIAPDKNVGLLDTDVFGPSVPLMMNLNDEPLLNEHNQMLPLTNYGIKCMSMGFLIAEKAPLIWRGLMVMQALEKLLRNVHWGPIDYLIVDTPPGTGDTHLSLVQNVPVAGTILVTTPQNASVQVTRRGAMMFQKLNVPIIGIVENMSNVRCTKCSERIQLFGKSGAEELGREFGVPVLGKVPLDQNITSSSDKGVPVLIGEPHGELSEVYRTLAERVVEFLVSK